MRERRNRLVAVSEKEYNSFIKSVEISVTLSKISISFCMINLVMTCIILLRVVN